MTWDGAGDNGAYLAGQAAFIAHAGSVAIAAKSNDPELFEATPIRRCRPGPMGTVSPIQPQLRAVPKAGRNIDTAQALLAQLAEPAFMTACYANAIYGPVLEYQAKLDAFAGKGLIHSGLLKLLRSGTAPGYPDVYNTVLADVYGNFVIPGWPSGSSSTAGRSTGQWTRRRPGFRPSKASTLERARRGTLPAASADRGRWIGLGNYHHL